ncbi:MAG: SCO family protein [Deltaproteobacteria bacterium]|nr:SCO family protein [Deltaproteobacteria bacterium]
MINSMRIRNLTFVTTVLPLLTMVWLSVDLSAFGASPPHAHEAGSPQKTPTAAAANVKAPDFTLIDQDGKRFLSTSLRGKIVVLDFIYTTCTDVCPLFTANFVRLQRRLATDHRSEVFLVSITTDPEIDSPKVLKAYAQRYGADFSNWAFLTGTEAQLKEVWKAFGIRVIRKGRGLVQHDSVTTLIDRQETRRFNHPGEKVRLEEVERDLLFLLAEKAKLNR